MEMCIDKLSILTLESGIVTEAEIGFLKGKYYLLSLISKLEEIYENGGTFTLYHKREAAHISMNQIKEEILNEKIVEYQSLDSTQKKELFKSLSIQKVMNKKAVVNAHVVNYDDLDEKYFVLKMEEARKTKFLKRMEFKRSLSKKMDEIVSELIKESAYYTLELRLPHLLNIFFKQNYNEYNMNEMKGDNIQKLIKAIRSLLPYQNGEFSKSIFS